MRTLILLAVMLVGINIQAQEDVVILPDNTVVSNCKITDVSLNKVSYILDDAFVVAEAKSVIRDGVFENLEYDVISNEGITLRKIANGMLNTERKKGNVQMETMYGRLTIKPFTKKGRVVKVMITTTIGSNVANQIEEQHDYEHRKQGSVYVDYWYGQY